MGGFFSSPKLPNPIVPAAAPMAAPATMANKAMADTFSKTKERAMKAGAAASQGLTTTVEKGLSSTQNRAKPVLLGETQ